ncbi:MAG: hypothetical protein IKY52_01905 [Clostridia bacterium]|nr:hypothetical protein [Clostridia bacterium]
MKKLFGFVLVFSTLWILSGCSEDVPEETIPIDLQTMAPETEAPESIPEQTETEEPAASVLLPAGEDSPAPPVAEADAVIYTEPSFAPMEILLTDFGDMVPDPEGYYYFQKDETIEIEYSCGIAMEMPVSWEFGGTTALDIPRRDAGIYSTKRMEYYNCMYRDTESQAQYAEKTTASGLSYRYWETSGGTLEGLDVVWHHCEFPVKAGDTFYFHIYFLTFSDDPEEYFEMHIQPILDSMEITLYQ